MGAPGFVRDATIGLMSGHVGNLVMGQVTTRVQGMESQQDREQEKQVSPGVSYTIAAEKLSARAGIHISQERAGQVGTAFHIGLGLGAGELYVLLRRTTALGPISAALIVSMALFLGLDEGLTPLMGWSAPATAYPLATHVRGLIGHLSLGATIAVTVECLDWLVDAE